MKELIKLKKKFSIEIKPKAPFHFDGTFYVPFHFPELALDTKKKILKELEKRYNKWKYLAWHYLFQNLFWQHQKKKIDWLGKEIRL